METIQGKDFLKQFFGRLGLLLIKLVGSRKSFYQLLSKGLALFLLLKLQNEWGIITVFGITSMADFVYFGFVTFEKVNTNINVGLGK